MIFFVPSDDSLGDDAKEKALLDTEELVQDDLPAAPDRDKVELDLDDAPFLEEEEEEEEEALDQEETPLAPAEEKKGIKELLKDKRILAAVIGGALLLIVLVIVIAMPSGEPETPEVAEPQPETENATAEDVEPAKPKELPISWEPFTVEMVDEDGKIRFLYCKFSSSTLIDKVAWEVSIKDTRLRDGIYYYLKNKDLTFLSDEKNVEILKKDLLNVINQYLSNGSLETLLIEEYLVK